MKIIFQKIKYKNFLSSGSTFTEIELNSSPLTLVIGKNGAGKSTILDALSFVLFNKPFRKVNKSQLVNSINNKQCVVEVEFFIGSDEWKIIRGIKPNIFEIYKNDVLLNQTNADNYQEYLETQILKCSHKSFCQIVVLGSADYIPFLDLPAGQRREIVENLLDLEIFSSMNVILKKRIIENNNLIDSLKKQKVLQEDRIQLQRKNNDRLIEDNKKKIEEATEEFVKVRIEIESLPKLKEVKDDQELVDKILSINSEIAKNIRLVDKGELNIKSIKNDLEFYQTSDNCPVCKQEIDKIFKDKTVAEKESDLNRYFKGVQILQDKLIELRMEQEKLQKESKKRLEIVTENNNIKNKLERFQWQQKEIEKKIEGLKKQRFEEENKELLKELEIELNIIELNFDKANKIKENMNILFRLLKDDGIKAKVISQYIGIINDLVNNYLKEMDFICQFTLDEQFNEKIKSRYRDEFSFANFSEGEKLRMTLAILLTWREIAKRRNSINTNILMFDEVLDSSLDGDGIDSFVQIIKNLTSENNTFIISHNSDNKSKFDNILEFKKEKGFSQIVK